MASHCSRSIPKDASLWNRVFHVDVVVVVVGRFIFFVVDKIITTKHFGDE